MVEKFFLSRSKMFLIASGFYTFLFLAINNILFAKYPWVLFCIPLIVVWFIAVCRPRMMAGIGFSLILSAAVCGYYVLLNIILPGAHPWSVYIIFAVMWYPFSLLQFKHKKFAFSLFGLFWSLAFFSTVNYITSAGEIWAVYPVFAVLWWPLSV